MTTQKEYTKEQIGQEYLETLATLIYTEYGVDLYDYSQDKIDTALLLDYINKLQIKLSFNIQDDALLMVKEWEQNLD